MCELLFHDEAEVILQCCLRLQRRVAEVGVIEVVERRHAVTLLGEGAQRQHLVAQRIGIDEYCGCQCRLVFGDGCWLLAGNSMSGVADVLHHERALRIEPRMVERRGYRGVMADAVRVGEVLHVGIQFVPLEVVGHACAPVGQYLIDMRRRHEEFLLSIGVINTQSGGVAIDVVGAVKGIFREQASAVFLPYALVDVCLDEGVVVRLPLAAPPHVVHYGSGDATLRVVCICLHVPSALTEYSEDVSLGAQSPDVSVLSCGGGVVSHGAVGVLAAVTEVVLAAGVEELGIHRTGEHSRNLLFPQCREAEVVARAVFRLELQVGASALAELRSVCLDIHRAGVAELRCRLEYGTLLSVVERYLVNVVHGELPQVHLSVLRVAQLYAVVEYAEVVASHRAYVHCLDASHAAIVLQLQSGEIAQRVGDVMRVQALQLLALHRVRWNHLAERQS